MSRNLRITPRGFAAGFSLIELMITLVISSIVILGLVSLITAIGVANRTQDGLARLQENGRFAMQRVAMDLRVASSQHCSTFDSEASILAGGGATYTDLQRAARAYYQVQPVASLRYGPVGLPAPYLISPRFMMIGHECDGANCTPALNAANRGVNLVGLAIPNMGAAAGRRARGADVLTLRYMAGNGVRVEQQTGQQPGGAVAQLELENDPVALAEAGFDGMDPNSPVWASDCSTVELFSGSMVGPNVVQMTGNTAPTGDLQMRSLDLRADARAFHLPTALRTVSYYLQLKADPRQPGRLISALMRKEGLNQPQELVEGVERLDFLYGVDDSLGRTRFLTATQVDALGAVGTDCPAFVPGILPVPAAGSNEPGCGWRAVKSIEVYMLVNTVEDLSSADDDEFRYSWLNTGAPNVANQFENPETLGTLRNGLPAGRMLRREFRTLVSLRGYNY
jgi:type IV pilus assembly protein PilW